MNKAKIDWVKNPDGTLGYTWNPITGCLNHINGMCRGGGFPCYAYRLAHTRLKERYLANKNIAPWGQFAEDLRGNIPPDKFGYGNPFYPRFWPERLYDRMPPVARVQSYIRYGKPCSETFAYRKDNYKAKGIFVCDMSDLFGIGIPEEWTKDVLGVCKANPKDRFYLLTKQPQNLAKFSPFPDNCWVGVTVTNDWDDRTYPQALACLSKIQAKVKYISFEPLLGEIVFNMPNLLKLSGVNWLIIGAQTKPYKPPKIEWVQEIVKAADKAGIPVFLKDNLRQMGDVSLQVEYLKQEMPK